MSCVAVLRVEQFGNEKFLRIIWIVPTTMSENISTQHSYIPRRTNQILEIGNQFSILSMEKNMEKSQN